MEEKGLWTGRKPFTKRPKVTFSVKIETPGGIKVFEKTSDIRDIYIMQQEVLSFTSKWKNVFGFARWNPFREAREEYKNFVKKNKNSRKI